MKKLILALSFILTSPLALAQNKYFTVYKDQNRLEYPQCKSNHRVLLNQYRNQIDSEIARLVVGIDIEESAKSPKIRINAYYNLLLQLTVKRIIFDEMINQLDKFNFNDFKTTEGLRKKVFNTDAININIKDRAGKTLEAALSKFKENELSEHIVDTIKLKLVTNTATAIGGQLLKSVGTGLIANLSGSALKGLLVGIGSEALAGAATGSILTILTIPLMGNRPPMETAWLDILYKHPEIIINPEWMTKAGSQDHPWVAHCYTILRRTESLEKILTSNLKKEENSFISATVAINKMEDVKPIEVKKDRFGMEYPKVAIDNTYVKKPVVILNIVPYWAKK